MARSVWAYVQVRLQLPEQADVHHRSGRPGHDAQYDTTGRKLIRLTEPDGKSIQYTYNTLYQLTGKIDRDGRAFSIVYSNNRPVALKDATGAAIVTLSNANNWATDPVALASRQVRLYVPSTTTLRDGRGNLWQYQYDANGYIIRVAAPDGTTTTYTYDPTTLLASSVTDANGAITRYEYDARGNLTKVTDALGFATSYTYEPLFNRLTSATDARGRVTTYGYDARGNRISGTDPLGGVQHWSYDSHGHILTATDKNGTLPQCSTTASET